MTSTNSPFPIEPSQLFIDKIFRKKTFHGIQNLRAFKTVPKVDFQEPRNRFQLPQMKKRLRYLM